MSTDIAESLPKRKFAQAAIANAPATTTPKGKSEGGKKGGGKPAAAKGGSGKGASEEGSEKRIRQAVYDIRYRARREDIDLKAAFSQYMSNSSLSQAERTAVREKLFGKAGGVSEMFANDADELAVEGVANALYKVFVEKEEDNKEIELAYLQQLSEDEANKKYKVRVTDKNGRSYVRFADRAKITELRQNPNIESVEMTEYGEPYEGERKRGEKTARAKGGGLDPVGKEDKDVNNDGKVNKTDKYLMKRRKAIGNAIRTRAEAYLADGTISTEPKAGTKKITGKDPITGGPVDNYSTGAVTISPDDGSKPVRKVGVYAHLELKGGALSESQKRMIEMYDTKKKKDELEKKDKVSSMMTKDSVKKEDEKEEEKPDMRSKYAMINIIKNKLRAAGQRDPMVMAVDACEETVEEGIGGMVGGALKKLGTKAAKVTKLGQKAAVGIGGLGVGVGGGKLLDDARKEGKKGKKKPRQSKPDYSKPLEYGVGQGKALIHYAPQKGEPSRPKDFKLYKKSMKTEERTPAQDDKSFDKMRPGGSNSQYDKDGKPKKKKPPTGPAGGESPFKPGVDNKIDPKKGKAKKTVIPVKVKTGATGGESQRKKDILPKPEKRTPFNPGVKKNIDPKKGTGKKTAVPAYNPYGKGASATPTNMAPGKP